MINEFNTGIRLQFGMLKSNTLYMGLPLQPRRLLWRIPLFRLATQTFSEMHKGQCGVRYPIITSSIARNGDVESQKRKGHHNRNNPVAYGSKNALWTGQNSSRYRRRSFKMGLSGTLLKLLYFNVETKQRKKTTKVWKWWMRREQFAT